MEWFALIVVGALAIWALLKAQALEERLHRMEEYLRGLYQAGYLNAPAARPVEPSQSPATAQPPTVAPQQTPPVPSTASVAPPVVQVSEPEREPVEAYSSAALPVEPDQPLTYEEQPQAVSSFTQQQPPPTRTQAQPATPGTSEQWEALLGGNWLNRIGAVALLIGLAFLIKYAFDNGWIQPWLLIAAGMVFGASLLFAADHFRKREAAVFAQGLVGAGVSILYLSSYASFNLYHLVSQMTAIALMSAVTVVAITQALRYDSITVSIVGLLGGFLTPAVLSSGGADPGGYGVLTYVTLLDIGLVVVAVYKPRWLSLHGLSLVATYIYYGVWYSGHTTPAMALFFLTVFWALFYFVDAFSAVQRWQENTGIRAALGVINSAVHYGFLYFLLADRFPGTEVWATVGLAVVYGAVAQQVGTVSKGVALFVPRYVITTVLLLMIAAAIEFSGYRLVIAWALEALAVAWAGLYFKKAYVWISALAIASVALIRLLLVDGVFAFEPAAAFVPIFSERFLAFLVLSAALGLTAWLFSSSEERTGVTAFVLHYVWLSLVFTLITVEINDHYRALAAQNQWAVQPGYSYARPMALAAAWILYSLPLVWIGLRGRLRPMVYSGLVGFGLALIFVAFQGRTFTPLYSYLPLVNLRAGMFILAIAGLLILRFWLSAQRDELAWFSDSESVFRLAAVWAGFELVTVEVIDSMSKYAQGLPELWATTAIAAAVSWMLFSLPCVWHGVRKTRSDLLYSGLIMAALATFVHVLVGFTTGPIAGYLPLLNLRAAAFAIVALGLLAHHQWLAQAGESAPWYAGMRGFIPAVVALLVFELVTADIWDFFQQRLNLILTGQGYGPAAESLNSQRQSALSAGWVIYSIILMGVGIWRRVRAVRLVALGLFYLSIAKVFLYDVSSLEPLYRIVSFLVLGVILLATSYLCTRYRDYVLGPAGD